MLELQYREDWEPDDWESAVDGRLDGYEDGRYDGYVSMWNIFEDLELDEALFYGNSWDDQSDFENEYYVTAYYYGYDEGFLDGFEFGDASIQWE